MRTIKELAPKPSDAVTAMIEGLLEQSQRSDFVIKMHTFIGFSRTAKFCFGCAATCALQKLAGVNYVATKELQDKLYELGERATYLNIYPNNVDNFERVMDEFRRGYIQSLFSYYGLYSSVDYPQLAALQRQWMNVWCLTEDNWRLELPLITKFRDELVALGY